MSEDTNIATVVASHTHLCVRSYMDTVMRNSKAMQ